MKKPVKVVWFGFLTWLIPFVASFAFYTKDRTLVIDEQLFKSIMIVLGSAVGAWLLVRYFRQLSGGYLRQGISVGLAWLALNLLLDVVILMPMADLSLGAYVSQIGLRYLTIPIMSIAMGALLDRRGATS